MSLQALRRRIDEADGAILRAFLERMELVEAVARHKREAHLPLTDQAREEAVLRRAEAEAGAFAPEARALFCQLIGLSKARQRRLCPAGGTEPVYGLIGGALSHSLSPDIHRALGLASYHLFELAPEALGPFLQTTPIGGLNVTMPYKRAVMPYCAALTPCAQAVGCVNTLLPRPEGGLLGDNTDVLGFSHMARRAGISFAGRKVLIFGGGGGGLAARYVAREEGAQEVVTISRSGPLGYDCLPAHADAEILVNATPLGMHPHVGKAPAELLAFPACRGVLDLVYNPLQTALLLEAEALGIAHSGGLPMLVYQAAASAEGFLGRPVSEEEAGTVLQGLFARRTNLVLIGMPGCGKTTVGRALAALTGREAVDLDEAFAEAAGMPVPAFLARYGEAAFRAAERALAARLGAKGGQILMTGGGAVTSPENFAALRQNGRLYHLLRPAALLAREGRPLSARDGLEALERERQPLYQRFRHSSIENSGRPEEVAARVWADFCRHFGL